MNTPELKNNAAVKKYLALNAHHETAVSNSDGVILKAGKYTIELRQNDLVISDGWLTDWVIIYNNGKWAHDGVFYNLSKKIKDRLDRIARSVYNETRNGEEVQ